MAEITLRNEGVLPGGILNIVVMDDRAIRTLNRRFLHKDRPTDVIAFPLDDDEVWGEVYVSLDRAVEQASAYRVSRNEELARLIVHGILHLTGWNDARDSDRKAMSAREDEILAALSVQGRPQGRSARTAKTRRTDTP